MSLVCCCKFHRFLPQAASPPVLQDVALQPTSPPVLAVEHCQQKPEMRHQRSLIGLSDTAWAISDPHSSFENDSTIHQPIDDESDSDHDQPQAAKKTGGTFDTVCNRLIQTFSHEDKSKHPSTSSLGNSEEEIARRAELRRLMRQRIQDELQTEQPDGIEKKSVSGTHCIASVVNLAVPTAGPRDAIEFAVTKSHSLDTRGARTNRDLPQQPNDAQEPHDSNTGQTRDLLDKTSPTGGEDVAENDAGKVDSSLLTSTGQLPTQTARRGKTEQSHSPKSFQLSNSATRLDRILGPDNSFNSRHASFSGDGHSALGVWLIAQGLRSRDNSTLHFDDDDDAEEAEVPDSIPAGSRPRLGGEEKNAADSEAQTPSRIQDKPFPNKPPVVSSTTAVEEPNIDWKVQNCKLNMSPRLDSQNNQITISARPENVAGPSTKATALNYFADNTSSQYPSKFQTSPSRSEQNLYRQNQSSQDKESSDEQQRNPAAGSKRRTEPYLRDKDPNTQNSGQITHNAASQPPSESASFLQREAELETIKRRFGAFWAHKKPAKQPNSRFQEEFNRVAPGQPPYKSFMEKIHLTVPGRIKLGSRQSEDQQEAISRPSRELNSKPGRSQELVNHKKEISSKSTKRSNLTIRPHLSPLSSEAFQKPALEHQRSATDLWRRAIRLEAQERRSSSNRLSTPNPDHPRSTSPNQSLRPTPAPQKGGSTGSFSTENTRREASQLTPTTDEVSPINNSKWLIQRWAAQMKPGTPHTTQGAESTASARLSSPPRSWARFPSHNREERNKNASANDQVHPRDFAIKLVSSDGQVCWATDVVQGEEKQRANTIPRSFSARLSKVVKSKIVKLMPSRHFQGEQGEVPAKGRVGSGTGHLEYPELEIKATESGYEELGVLEREINNIKSDKALEAPEGEVSRPRSSKSLGDRISALMHDTARESQHNHSDFPTFPENSAALVTPSARGESTIATDVFVTPASRLSDASIDEHAKVNLDKASAIISEQEKMMQFGNTDQQASHAGSETWTGVFLNEPATEINILTCKRGSISTPQKQQHLSEPLPNETDSMSIRRYSG
ncbi:hypothetical protein FALBO_12272 [Fusarium albosuccineum]|uniref:Uncharacterized protein n=1 Tax=Fusarium albosuccineum TaxID=1237068 RepID=A0A8H4L3F6_9HYPO|nr:hypothetical protein FALBO_12272 [Fusarium albosuccineum]